MNHATRFAITGVVVAMVGLTGCVLDRGGPRPFRGPDGGAMQQRNLHDRDSRDRDGRPCDQRGEGRHDADCRPRERDGGRG